MSLRFKLLGAVVLVVLLTTVMSLAAFPLGGFARRVARADTIVATTWGSPATLSVTAEHAQAVLTAVRSAVRDTRTYANVFDVKVRFFQGTNLLGEIASSGRLFLVRKRQYRDDSGVMKTLLVTPVYEKAMRQRRQERGEE